MIDHQTSKRPFCIDYAAERQRHAAERYKAQRDYRRHNTQGSI